MNREDVKIEIRKHWKELYPLDKGGKGIICPLCNNGAGAEGPGIRENPQAKTAGGLKCFKCGFSGDIIDLIQQDKGMTFNEALNYAADALNISIDGDNPEYRQIKRHTTPQDDFSERESVNIPHTSTAAENGLKTPEIDNTEYYRKCAERLTDPDAVSYLSARGITIENARAAHLGFDPEADPANSNHSCPRIIIPVTKAHYIGRSIDPNTPKAFAKLNNKGAKPGIFNLDAIWEDSTEAVFVTEGAFDAMSIRETGADAIALNSTSNAAELIKRLEAEPTRSTLILCLDNDDAGHKAMQTLREGLRALNISFIETDICNGAKDPNEALTTDKEKFVAAVRNATAQTAARPDSVSSYIDLIMGDEIDDFKEATNRKTGFENLDKEANGLYSGLYVIAALSSLGKTTFAHQIADQIAAAGTDVLFFSLEQSRLELVSKSIARLTAQKDIANIINPENTTNAVDSLSIRRGYLPGNVIQAAKDYKEAVGGRLSIIEGNFNCNISFIGDYIRQYMKKTGTKPVIFIDYLQILQGEPEAKRQTTKEMIDTAVTELKRISRALGLTVFVISSVNRANYLTPIDFESLKESGGIEYTADVIWGLQLQCLNDPIFDKANNIKERRQTIKEQKKADPRKIELVCLKNRYGISNFSCFFDYYPKYDLFKPGELATEFDSTPPKKAGRKL